MPSRWEKQLEAVSWEQGSARPRPTELWWRLVRSETLARLLRELMEGADYDGERCAGWSALRSERVLGGVFSTADLLALAESPDATWFGVALSLPLRVDRGLDPIRIAAYDAELAAAVSERRLRVVRPSELRAALSRSVNAVALATERGSLATADGVGRDEPAVMAQRALARGAAHWVIDERRGRDGERAA
jgi:hypothetical protein